VYGPRQLLRGLRDPTTAAAELRRRCREPYLRLRRRLRDPPVDVMAADWDTLAILDACRYDLFAAANTLGGDLRRVVSKGTGTDEFVHENFAGGRYGDTVYVTANPHLQFVDARFHEVVRLWQTDWDDDLDTVRPETATDRALAVHERFPNKRVIVHYVQPHYPFIGPRGRRLGDRYRGFLERDRSVFHALEAGDLDAETVWAAYRENLDLALPAVERLREGVDGLTVVTSDHGNAFGEWGVYGHGGPDVPALVDVPWLVGPHHGRRRVVDDGAEARTNDASAVGDSGAVAARLRDLGYY
jgi:hypothetical protein